MPLKKTYNYPIHDDFTDTSPTLSKEQLEAGDYHYFIKYGKNRIRVSI